MNVQPLPPDPDMKKGASEAPQQDSASEDGFGAILLGQTAALEDPAPARDADGSARPPVSDDANGLKRAVEHLADLGRRLGTLGATAPSGAAAAAAATETALPGAAAPGAALPGSADLAAALPGPADTPLAAAGAAALRPEAEAPAAPLPVLPEAALPPGATEATGAGRLSPPPPAVDASSDANAEDGATASDRDLAAALREKGLDDARAAESRAFESTLEARIEARAEAPAALPTSSPLAGAELVAGSSPSFGPSAPAAALPVGSPQEAVPVHVEWLAAKGGGRARFQLHPPNLGSVELSVTVRGSSVDIVVHTQDPAAQAAVVQSRELLAEGLAGRDLRIETFDVRSVGSAASLDGGLTDDRGSGEARPQTFDASGEGHASRDQGPSQGDAEPSPNPPVPDFLAAGPTTPSSAAAESVDLHI